MLSFKDFDTISEDAKDTHALHLFDLDQTLFDHDKNKLRIHVLNPAGQRVQTISNTEFNRHILPKDHKYDFHEFKSSKIFGETAKPIHKMIQKLKDVSKNSGNAKIITARGDMDDQQKFAQHMMKYGIDIDKVHVHRAGNESEKPHVAKAAVVHNLISNSGYNKVHLYDDDQRNLDEFLKLKSKHKEVEFHGHHVQYHPDTGHVDIETKKV